MKLTKGKIEEIIDGDGNIMGSDDKPEVSPNIETQASKTTDYNAKVHGQNFKNDFLGRFGFYFYESEGDNTNVEDMLAKIMYEKYKETLNHYKENPDKLESDWELHQNTTFEDQPEGSKEHDYEWASDILKALAPHMKKDLNEANVAEDKIQPKKEDKLLPPNKDSKGLKSGGNVDKVADLLGKLPKAELDKLINLLESKSSSKNVTKPEGLKKKMDGVSLGQDEKGYYVYTHRARSKSYESPEKIPDSKIKYIETTG